MADRGAGVLSPGVRRGLLLAGLGVAAWAVVRVVLLVAGVDGVVADDDPHGYGAIFSLFLTPVLALAVGLLVGALRRGGPLRAGAGVAVAVAAPLASPVALVAVAVGVAIVVAALVERRNP
ncbi:hypothetical protein AB0A74_13235 [Saccharothrix sp. NPDC042600]|uniref:hypothetical protein n=1 Tax=Saccharothrix TaxID=2071 RepID=UPI0033CC5C3E|nr:hypothetical protein GCM10017745_38610 [Saccharothrix mutabilis subsp. capreolus]